MQTDSAIVPGSSCPSRILASDPCFGCMEFAYGSHLDVLDTTFAVSSLHAESRQGLFSFLFTCSQSISINSADSASQSPKSFVARGYICRPTKLSVRRMSTGSAIKFIRFMRPQSTRDLRKAHSRGPWHLMCTSPRVLVQPSRTGPRATTLRAESRLPPTDVDSLLIWPRGGNSGDMLIADACERYLKMRGVAVWRSDGSIEDACLENDSDYLGDLFSTFRGMVMFPGGGNIGIYPDNGQIRGAVISHLRQHHRCLVFSQSALQPEPALIDSRVTVWCRDSTSQAILRTAGIQTDLVPDMALFMDDTIPNY